MRCNDPEAFLHGLADVGERGDRRKEGGEQADEGQQRAERQVPSITM